MDLVRQGYAALAAGTATVPAVPFVFPRDGAFLRAMPAHLPEHDIVALKWIGGHDKNPERGLPYLSGLIVVNDPETTLPAAVIDCGAITAARTAAASGLCVAELAPEGWSTAAVIGYGVQGRAHVDVLRQLNPDARIRVATRTRPTGVAGDVEVVDSVAEAVAGAQVVVTAIPLSTRLDPLVTAGPLAERALVLPVDFDASVSADLVAAADLFLTDDLAGFTAARQQGSFVGWPTPEGTVGDFLSGAPDGPVGPLRVCCNLGVGSLDALFGAAVARAGVEAGRGIVLEQEG
jgi:ornithine cyclodeaminase/alanine dehydrogenase-like protein (mu-crystallin family)